MSIPTDGRAALPLLSWRPLPADWTVAADDVHVMRIAVAEDAPLVNRLMSMLDERERERALRFRFDLPRQQFVTGRAMLRWLLARTTFQRPNEICFRLGPRGKPELDPPGSVSFNVSHSGPWVLIALRCTGRLGVDVEAIDPAVRWQRLSERYFSVAEQSELTSLGLAEQVQGFYRGWTSKESFLKALGCGVSYPLEELTMQLNPAVAPRLVSGVADVPNWTFREPPPLSGAVATVCAEHPAEVFHWWDVAAERCCQI